MSLSSRYKRFLRYFGWEGRHAFSFVRRYLERSRFRTCRFIVDSEVACWERLFTLFRCSLKEETLTLAFFADQFGSLWLRWVHFAWFFYLASYRFATTPIIWQPSPIIHIIPWPMFRFQLLPCVTTIASICGKLMQPSTGWSHSIALDSITRIHQFQMSITPKISTEFFAFRAKIVTCPLPTFEYTSIRFFW